MIIFPVIAVAVSSILSIMVLKQYVERKKPYQLMWGIGFTMFSIASAAEVLALLNGWNLTLLRVYYLFGATLLVGYLGLGTIYLLRGNLAKISLAVVLAASLVALVLIMQTKLDVPTLEKFNAKIKDEAAVSQVDLKTSGEKAEKIKPTDSLVKPALLRVIAVLLNILGTFALVGGAAYSAISAYRKHLPANIFYGTALLAAGAFVIASGGTASGIAGISGQIVLSATISIGIIIMFAGFLFTNKKPASTPNISVTSNQNGQ